MILAQNHLQRLNGNKLLAIAVLFFLGTFFSFTFSQRYAVVVVQNGKKFYQHTVTQGNTLFGLQQIYDCPAEEILNANPGIERGLVEGQLVKIPAPSKTIIHTVQKSETMFAISRMYGVPVDTITAYNPGADIGIKIGQRLKLVNAAPRIQVDLMSVTDEEINKPKPAATDTTRAKYTVSFKDSLINHTVLQGETIYTISKRFMVPVEEIQRSSGLSPGAKVGVGQVIKIPIKKEKIDPVPIRVVPPKERSYNDSVLIFPKKDFYNVAIFLPFNLDSTGTFNKNLTNAAFDYYVGAKLAFDSLQKAGLRANVYFYDYLSKSESLQQQLARNEFQTMDLIFAPLQAAEAEFVANWAKLNKVRCVLSVAMPAKMTDGNRFVYALTPDNDAMMKSLAKRVYNLHVNQQIILIRTTKADEELLQNSFLRSFKELPPKNSRPRIIETDWNNFKSFENLSSQTIVIFLSNDKEKAISLLERYKNAPNMMLFGTKDWVDWKEVSSTLSNKYRFSYAAPSSFDLKEANTNNFHRKVRRFFDADLTKTMCLGYDVVFQSCNAFFMKKEIRKGLISNFQLYQAGPGNGVKNEGAFVVKFVDFESKNDE
ncbi:MAG: hypothetical protein RL264_2114 [Bacteroidota bacterium]|jgi:LysM repeat protein